MPKTRERSRGGSRGGNQNDFLSTVREHPYATAAAAAGTAGVAAASAFLWARRGQIGETVSSGLRSLRSGDKPQSDIAEEALTLKESGRKTKGPRGPIAQQDIKSGVATSNQEMKAGAKAYS